MRSSFDTRRWPHAEGVGARALTVAAAIVGSAVVGGVMSSQASGDAADTAANAQISSTQAGIDERRAEFDRVQSLLQPYVTAGTTALGQQQTLIGMNGAGPQQAAIDQLQTMPGFQSQLKLGENRILQNASATGGLRGGNTQGAIGYFAPSLLAQHINDQYGRLGGMTSIGQNAAAGVGNAGMQTGAGVSDLLGQQGSAIAGAALANGRAQSSLYNSFSGALGQYFGMGGGFGGGVSPDAIQGAFAQTGAGSSGFGTGFAYGNQDYGLFI